MKEFELINRYFKGRGIIRRDVNLGIGDDCALVTVPENCQLAVTTDTLVAGVHFFDDISPRALGHRALAVNLSDLAAMGAEPTWISVGLTLPEVNMEWIEQLENFILTASYGGRDDSLIEKHNLRYAKVVFSEAEAESLGLEIDHDDSHAADPHNQEKSFALLLHGTQPKDTEAAIALRKLKGKGSYSRRKKNG